MEAAIENNTTVQITLPDGAVREYDAGVTGMEIANSISKSLAKACIAIRIDGELSDLSLPITGDVSIALIKRDNDEALEMIRHDAAHVMAEAVQNLFPETQVTIGPSIENGFYYDFARDEPFSTDDFPKIEKEMRKIIERNSAFIREVWDRETAIKYFTDKGEAYKAELIEDLPESEDIAIYRQGENGSKHDKGWLDLCRGPHMPSTKHVGQAFKLMKVAGAYWRGDSSKTMLTRIYGTAWRDQKELDSYLNQLEEAEARDHRKLGAEMDLFHMQSEAQGSVFWHPKGYTIYNQLEGYVRRRLEDDGYSEVRTPQLMNSKFWKESGHWQKYREDMFVVPDVVPNNNEDGPVYDEEPKEFLALKPMNCPAHVQIFNQGIKSYKDLPIRLSEFGCCHRNEAHGALHGMMRLRQFVQDDAHIFCSEDQVLEESIKFFKLVQAMYKDLGFDDYKITFETRPDVRIGSDDMWDKAEFALENALKEMNLDYEICEGDGAFYGPKVGFIIRDAIGREWGCGTLQLDFNLPERLDATYVAQDGSKQRPVMLHRAALGALERFIGILIESYAGKLPLWLQPVQCVVASITGDANDYATKVYEELIAQGIRAELDVRNEKINYKVREHSLAKVPALFVVGMREAEENKVAIRRLGSQAQNVEDTVQAIADLVTEAKAPY